MTQPYRHVLLTRFNVEMPFAAPGRGIDETWLRDRLHVFRHLTLPSVRAQMSSLDAWLVFFNAKSPDWFKDGIAGFDALVPVWVDGPLGDERIAEIVRERGFADRDFLITTRVDNDDALSSSFLQVVQERFNHQARLFIEFPRGLEYANGDCYRKTWRSNPFLSLIESTEQPITTVFSRRHTEVVSKEPTMTVWLPNMWLQNSHPMSATSQTVKNTRPVLRSGRPNGFACDWDDDGGRLSRRLSTALRSVPYVTPRAIRLWARQVRWAVEKSTAQSARHPSGSSIKSRS